ncbi:Peptidase M12A astacin [Fusarium acutatum]|uniref:Peptidase M12A astacin n=1 Tax=Fusarium acutatum TaxID=78861 RepID=A0A8H4JX51_9HYPO|nr:Peptidase M12A astacin [Fusarium acutatum]
MSSNSNIHYCTQLIVPEELAEEAIQAALQENPENIISSPVIPLPPAGGIIPSQRLIQPRNRLGFYVNKSWRNGRTIRVRFLSGASPYVHEKIKQYANVWSKYANVHFKFVNSAPEDIRISFVKGDRSWSAFGTDCLTRAKNKATMNFGWFDDNTSDEEFSRTTIHEFGHALGCIHENCQPNADIQWNKPVVYEAYKRSDGWSPEQVDSQVLYHYDRRKDGVNSSKYDRLSIMAYSIPKEFTMNGFSVPWNTHLSATDIAFISRIYPKPKRTHRLGHANDLTYPTSSHFDVGAFTTISVAAAGRGAKDHRTLIQFPKSYPSAPLITAGISFIDFENSDNPRIKSLVEAVLPSQAVLNLHSYGGSGRHDGGMSWLLCPPGDADFQCGSFTTKGNNSTQSINFDRAYSSPPKVVVFFSALDIDKSTHCCVKTYASNVTENGFKLHIETWNSTKVLECGASWVAVPVNKSGIAVGTFGEDENLSLTDGLNTAGGVEFKPSFTQPPRIFLALNMLNIDRGGHTCVRISCSHVMETQMEWRIDTWGAYCTDVEDAARLLVFAVALPSIVNERISAYCRNSTWNELRCKIRHISPKREKLVNREDQAVEARDLWNADGLIKRAQDILRGIGQQGFASEEDICVTSWIASERHVSL